MAPKSKRRCSFSGLRPVVTFDHDQVGIGIRLPQRNRLGNSGER
jgi:hypothetical protein